jgi:exonuclease VII small subunit
MKKDETFKLQLTYFSGKIEILESNTNDLEWSMAQYQRNRDVFTWKIIDDNEN